MVALRGREWEEDLGVRFLGSERGTAAAPRDREKNKANFSGKEDPIALQNAVSVATTFAWINPFFFYI